MSESLFLSYDGHNRMLHTADNLIIAKIMHDIRKPFATTKHFVADEFASKNDSFFFDALSILFSSPVCMDYGGPEDEWSSDEELKVTYRSVEIQRWNKIKEYLSQENLNDQLEIFQEHEELLKELLSFEDCDAGYMVEEVTIEASLLEQGFHLKIEGYSAMYFPFLQQIVTFLDQLNNYLSDWEEMIKENESWKKQLLKSEKTKNLPQLSDTEVA